jgi:DegV family protein with EDD domain
MRRLIVTDSTADIPEALVEENGIKVIPITVILNGKNNRDGVDISRTDFYEGFDDYKEMATQAIRYEDYALDFLQMIKKYDEIIIILCSSYLSESYNIAVKVNKEFNRDGSCKVEVIDSCQCSMGLGMMVLAAAEATEQGGSFDRVISIINKTRMNMNSYMAIPTLKYLRKNKKITGMKALFGSAMGAKPVLEFSEDGKLEIKTKLFGNQKNMILSMMDKIKEDVGGRAINLSIIYAGNRNLVQNLKDVFEAAFDCHDVYIARFGPAITINTGPESYAVFFSAVNHLSTN